MMSLPRTTLIIQERISLNPLASDALASAALYNLCWQPIGEPELISEEKG